MAMIEVGTTMVQFDGLVKQYGRLDVLKQLTLSIEREQVTAIVGHNGSGKTTLIKILLGLVKPDEGRIFFDGHKLNGDVNYREDIGYMPQIACFPENLSVAELIDLIKDMRGRQESLDEELFEAFGISKLLAKRLKHLSGGSRQKVSAMLAFLFKPRVVVLDEPTAGLDPVASGILKDKIVQDRNRGVTFILTTHIVSELDALADNIAFLADGKVFIEGRKTLIQQRAGEENLERAIAHLMQESAA